MVNGGKIEMGKDLLIYITKASKTIGCLRVPIFLNQTLSVDTKRAAYKAVVILFCYVE